ncbi:MAG: 2-oxoacid:acceptor oxidoreductase subunit alpha [Patescibacteria group bacterium]|jgi:2-oxoglutarate ferredoxin oxidoreductase subunit alpha
MAEDNNITTILLGGEAGDGVKEAGISFSKLLLEVGQKLFISFEYPSLIRGGHNSCSLSFSNEKVFNNLNELDIVIAFNKETVELHKKELRKGGIIIIDSDKAATSNNNLALPMSAFTKKQNAHHLARTSVALGALVYYFSLPLNKLEKIFKESFKNKAKDNIVLARQGFEYAKKNNWPQLKIKIAKKGTARLIDGNQAFAEGLLSAGLENYIAYPMTPATSILHFLAEHKDKYKIKVIQPENEIAAAIMAIGASYAGKRSAVGTSGGGFALMQESFSLAGITEIPFVAVISQRPGPATGVPTGTGQADLAMLKNAGHGEFPLVVLAPGDAEESYEAGARALNLAWQFQVPVLVLLDKHLSESIASVDLKENKKIVRGKLANIKEKNYKRYSFFKDGISPMAFPGTRGLSVKSNSYEHDERGIVTENPTIVKKMFDKRFKKIPLIIREINNQSPLKVYGDKKATNAIIFWGSTKGAVLEAIKNIKQSIKAIQIISMEPFPDKKLASELKQIKKIIAVEGNAIGQLASLIREKTGIEIKNKILRYDSKPFNPADLAEKINKELKK